MKFTKEYRKIYNQDHYLKNKEKKRIYGKQQWIINKDARLKANNIYRKKNIVKVREYDRKLKKKIFDQSITSWLLGDSLPYWKRKITGKMYSKLDPEYLQELTIKQSGCCYYLGIPLRPFKKDKEAIKKERGLNVSLSQILQQVSIDKLDPKKGYTKGNIVLASMFINQMKGICTLDQFKTLILMMTSRLKFNEKNHSPDKDLTRIFNKINTDYTKKVVSDMKKIKKLQAKNLVKAVDRFPGKLIIEKGKLVRTN
tara:strand:- start:80 stop:844 length:765 start_codon:yes stop_codon:yes gene_type:complete